MPSVTRMQGLGGIGPTHANHIVLCPYLFRFQQVGLAQTQGRCGGCAVLQELPSRSARVPSVSIPPSLACKGVDIKEITKESWGGRASPPWLANP